MTQKRMLHDIQVNEFPATIIAPFRLTRQSVEFHFGYSAKAAGSVPVLGAETHESALPEIGLGLAPFEIAFMRE